ncbi:hypothetical protein ACWGI1_05915 [Streptomyces sp. NPDC054835]
MLNRIRRAITRTRRRRAPKAAQYRTPAPATFHDRTTHMCTLAGEDTALVRPYVLTAEERASWRSPAASTWLAALEAL